MPFSWGNLLIWLLIALVGGLIGERIARRRAPDGIIGATIIGFIAMLLIIGLLHIYISSDIWVAGVPLITSLVIAAITVALWSGLAYHRVYRRGYDSYSRRRSTYARRPRRRRYW